MFKLRTKARADCRVSPAISADSPRRNLTPTLGCLSTVNKPSRVSCLHLTNRSIVSDTFLHCLPLLLLFCLSHQYILSSPVRLSPIPPPFLPSLPSSRSSNQ